VAVFYVPLDVPSFSASNPEFADVPPPAQPGLTLDAVCLSCGDPTDNVAEIVSGARMGSRSESFEQPVYLCDPCLADRDKTRGRLTVVRSIRVVVAVVTATVTSAAVRAGLGVSEISATALWLLLLPTVYMLGAVAIRGPRPLGRWRPVEVFWFRDPRKGDDAEFLCVRIDNPERSARFAALNPHAIDAERWDASYLRSAS
jgi:hypothetical protein